MASAARRWLAGWLQMRNLFASRDTFEQPTTGAAPN